jgi:serine/threonine protein kinase
MYMQEESISLGGLDHTSVDGYLLWTNMNTALQTLHDMGLAHMDIKPDNVCISCISRDAPISYVLIDVGSVTSLKSGRYTNATTAFLPHERQPDGSHGGKVKASTDTDWWMLAMTLIKVAGLTPTRNPDRVVSYREQDIREYLGEPSNFDQRIWNELRDKLKDSRRPLEGVAQLGPQLGPTDQQRATPNPQSALAMFE